MSHTVLLVDDDEKLLEGLQRQLHKEPYRVLTARSGQEALDILHGICVDIVISDQEMPGLKGTQFLWQVRKAFPGIILFMLTGHPSLPMTSLAIQEVGIARLFAKPCSAVDMALTIRQALQHRDLAVRAGRLLEVVKKQNAALDMLKRTSPHLAQQVPEISAIITLDGEAPHDQTVDCGTLISEIDKTLGAAWESEHAQQA
jgi:DNA-binding NtrC family response regulator